MREECCSFRGVRRDKSVSKSSWTYDEVKFSEFMTFCVTSEVRISGSKDGSPPPLSTLSEKATLLVTLVMLLPHGIHNTVITGTMVQLLPALVPVHVVFVLLQVNYYVGVSAKYAVFLSVFLCDIIPLNSNFRAIRTHQYYRH